MATVQEAIASAQNVASGKSINPAFPVCRNAALIVVQLLFAKAQNTTVKSRKKEVKSSCLHFRLLTLCYRIRDFFRPRSLILKETGIKAGDRVLDFGCGPGSYIVPLSKLVGPEGKIYALDINPLAIKMVRQIANRNQLENVIAIHSDSVTGFPDNYFDVILLYDVFHHLERPDAVLKDLHRLLKPEGILSFSDHHLKEAQFLPVITRHNLFELYKKGRYTYSFKKLGVPSA